MAALRRGDDARAPLTPRQAEVARLVTLGLSNRAIAAQLRVSEQAIKNAVSRLLVHFGVSTRAALARDRAVAEGRAARDRAIAELAQIVPFAFGFTSGSDHVLRIASPMLRAMVGPHAIGTSLRRVGGGDGHALIAVLDRVWSTAQPYSGRASLGSEPAHLVVMQMRDSDNTLEGLLLIAVPPEA